MAMTYEYVTTFQATGSTLGRKRTRDRCADENQTKLVLDWRHLHENYQFNLHSKQACLHHLQEMQQNCSIFIHIRHPSKNQPLVSP
jgi:inorganic triphosphatase YgiF